MDRARDEKFMRAALNEAKRRLAGLARTPRLERFSLIGNRIWRADIIGEQAAITLRLNASAISPRLFRLGQRFTLLLNHAPQKGALLRAQMRYSRRESETSLSARLT